MKKILLFILVYCILSKNAFTSSVTVQSVFFVTAIIKSGIFTRSKQVTVKNVILGAVILISGFALSVILTLYCASEDIPKYILLSLTAFGLYFCCYSFVIAMDRHFNSEKQTKITTLICTLFPSTASIASPTVSPFLTVILIIFGSTALYFTAKKAKKDVRRHPK